MRKNLIYLLSILLVCLLILGIISLTKKIKQSTKPGLKVNVEKVDNFILNSKEGDYSFIKETGIWKIEIPEDGTVSRYETDPELAKQFLEKIKNTELYDVVTENKDRFAEFQVDDLSGTKVKLFNGKKLLASFIIGTISMANYENVYFRFENKNQVWLAKSVEPWLVARKGNNWRNMQVVLVDKESISQLELKFLVKPKDTILLTKVSDYWLVDKTDKKANQEKMNQLINTLSNFKAEGIAEKNVKFEKPDFEMNVKIGDKSDVLTFAKSGSECLMQKNHSEPNYRIYDFKLNYLKPARKELLTSPQTQKQ